MYQILISTEFRLSAQAKCLIENKVSDRRSLDVKSKNTDTATTSIRSLGILPWVGAVTNSWLPTAIRSFIQVILSRGIYYIVKYHDYDV